ncbi:MAG: hypothetical protein HY823_08190 [Acidobacteria bacterium]|nr:hypothetical protein [Acidobacteriota bacterium]
MSTRRSCPSCQHRLSPLATECPVCGLSLERPALPRPLLFQASALQTGGRPGPPPAAIATPALGRVTPVRVSGLAEAEPPPEGALRTLSARGGGLEEPEDAPQSSFWPLVQVELGEALVLGGAHALVALLSILLLGVPPARAYTQLWPFLLPIHFILSWALLMVPLVTLGQSPLMVFQGVGLASEQPERRMAFSLFHLLSVTFFPLSFLCMVLTPNHRTLAELLTGQEILARGRPA